jgi:hypothetical protein
MFFWWSSGSSRGSAAAFLLIALIVGFIFSLFLGASTPWLRMVTIIVPVFFLVLPFVLYVMQGGKKGQARSEPASTEKEKPKRGESLAELMSILNDEDIDDLRARVKLRLEEQIDSADADEMESFEDLLGETKEKRR